MSGTNFAKILDEAISEITNKLYVVKNNKYNQVKEFMFNSVMQKNMYKEAEELIERGRKLQEEAALLDPKMTDAEEKEYVSLGVGSTWMKRKSDLLTAKELKDDPVNINIAEFKKIKNKFQNMIRLAVGSKEQREILIRFYSIDWKQLGIDVPPDIDISSVTVTNGVLNSGIKLLS